MEDIKDLIIKNWDWIIISVLALIQLILKFVSTLTFWNRDLGCFNLIINIPTLLAVFILDNIFGIDKLPFEEFTLFILSLIVLFVGYYLIKRLYFKLTKGSMYRRVLLFIVIVGLLIAIGMLLEFCVSFSLF